MDLLAPHDAFDEYWGHVALSGVGTLGDQEGVCADCGAGPELQLLDKGVPYCVRCAASTFAEDVKEAALGSRVV